MNKEVGAGGGIEGLRSRAIYQANPAVLYGEEVCYNNEAEVVEALCSEDFVRSVEQRQLTWMARTFVSTASVKWEKGKAVGFSCKMLREGCK